MESSLLKVNELIILNISDSVSEILIESLNSRVNKITVG